MLSLSVSYAQTPALQWAKSWGSTGHDVSNAVVVDESGNVITAGSFEGTVDFNPSTSAANVGSSQGGTDGFVSKLDANGGFVWSYQLGTVGSDTMSSVAVDGTGNVYAAGYKGGNAVITKLTSTGALLWEKEITGVFRIKSIAVNPTNGHVYATGTFISTVDVNPDPSTTYNITSTTGSYVDLFVLHLSEAGDFVNVQQVAGNVNKNAYGIALDNSGNAYISGRNEGNIMFPSSTGNIALGGLQPAFIAKYNSSSNNFDWVTSIGLSEENIRHDGISVAVDANSNAYVAGATTQIASEGRVVENGGFFLSKFNSSGTSLWINYFDGVGVDAARSVAVDAQSNVYVTGVFSSTVDFNPSETASNELNASSGGLFLAKYNTSGAYQWSHNVSGVTPSLAVDAQKNVYLTGRFAGTNLDYDFGTGTSLLSSNGSKDVLVLKINQCEVVTLTPATLSSMTVGFPYSQTLSADGMYAPVFTVTSGSLPSGLTLSASGVISGTPTQSGNFSVTITATSGACVSSNSYSFTVQCPVVTILPASLTNGYTGLVYSQTLSLSQGTATSYIVSSGSLPAGLSLSANGVISGTPSQVGTYSFSVSVNYNSCTYTNEYTLVVNCNTITPQIEQITVNGVSVPVIGANVIRFDPNSFLVNGAVPSQYNVRYRKVGSSTWTTKTELSDYRIVGLDSASTYEWQIRNICVVGGVFSDWSALRTFTTKAVSSAPHYDSDPLTENDPIQDYDINDDRLCAPLNVRTGIVGQGVIQIVWPVLTDRTIGFEVQHRVKGTTTWTTYSSPYFGTGTSWRIFGLNPSTTYEWRFRSVCRPGQDWHPWSSIHEATTTAMPICAPFNASVGTVTSTSAVIKWTEFTTNSLGYELRYRVQGTITWTTYASPYWFDNDGPTAVTINIGLTPSTTYEWQIRNVCNPGGDWNAWSALSTFTTGAARLGQETFNVSVYPVPSTGLVNVQVADLQETAQYEVYNVFGQRVAEGTLAPETNILDLSKQSTGVYTLKVVTAKGSATKQVVLNK